MILKLQKMVQFKTILKNSIKIVIPLTIVDLILKKNNKKSFNYISQSMSLQRMLKLKKQPKVSDHIPEFNKRLFTNL